MKAYKMNYHYVLLSTNVLILATIRHACDKNMHFFKGAKYN